MGVSNPASLYPGGSGGGPIVGKDGKDGAPGKSAYELALDHGYVGSELDWLDSLIGPPGVDGNGKDGANGKSAYQIALENGFKGTKEEWLKSLQGANGKSAYEIAQEKGFEGTEEEWLKSLVGPPGEMIMIEGDIPVKPITREDYDALPEEEKNGNTLWVIIDTSGPVSPDPPSPPFPPSPSFDGKTYKFSHEFITTETDNVVNVNLNMATDFNGDNTLPIQAAAVQTIVGNIDALLATI